jgi:hypothetical protein
MYRNAKVLYKTLVNKNIPDVEKLMKHRIENRIEANPNKKI